MYSFFFLFDFLLYIFKFRFSFVLFNDLFILLVLFDGMVFLFFFIWCCIICVRNIL